MDSFIPKNTGKIEFIFFLLKLLREKGQYPKNTGKIEFLFFLLLLLVKKVLRTLTPMVDTKSFLSGLYSRMNVELDSPFKHRCSCSSFSYSSYLFTVKE